MIRWWKQDYILCMLKKKVKNEYVVSSKKYIIVTESIHENKENRVLLR